MKIKLKTLIMAWVVIILLTLWLAVKAYASFDSRVNHILTGGEVSTKSMSLWELHRYKDTTLMRKSPLRWCPFKAYQTVGRWVSIESRDNRNWLCVNADLTVLLREDAAYNRRFAKAFRVSGSRKNQVRQIWNYCRKTQYAPHIKTAREVFALRRGDCAGIASAFYVLCRAKNIPVRYVIGWTLTGCHAWDKVKLSGVWYNIDATFGYWLSRKQYYGRTVMEQW